MQGEACDKGDGEGDNEEEGSEGQLRDGDIDNGFVGGVPDGRGRRRGGEEGHLQRGAWVFHDGGKSGSGVEEGGRVRAGARGERHDAATDALDLLVVVGDPQLHACTRSALARRQRDVATS
jgi:hypothetical protein